MKSQEQVPIVTVKVASSEAYHRMLAELMDRIRRGSQSKFANRLEIDFYQYPNDGVFLEGYDCYRLRQVTKVGFLWNQYRMVFAIDAMLHGGEIECTVFDPSIESLAREEVQQHAKEIGATKINLRLIE